MKRTDKLSKKQVLAIPKLLEKNSIGKIAERYSVSWQAIWYWVGQLRKRGTEVKTRGKGQASILDVKTANIKL